jgi:hypothetical protein
MRHLILSLIILTCWAGEAQKLPADVQTVIDKAESAKVKVDQALIKDLAKLQETYTKKGNLDAATAIREKIEATKKLIPDVLGDGPSVLCGDVVLSEKFYVSDLIVGASRLLGGGKAVASIRIPKGEGVTFKYTQPAQNYILPFTVTSKAGGYIYIGSYKAITKNDIAGSCKVTPSTDCTIQGMNNCMRVLLLPGETVTVQVHEPTVIAEGFK